jgi:hypothetical protein
MGLFALGIEHPLDVTVTPMRAIIECPPRLHSINTSIAVCHSGRSDSLITGFRSCAAAACEKFMLSASEKSQPYFDNDCGGCRIRRSNSIAR